MADRRRFKNAAAYGAKSKSSSEIQVWSCGFVVPPENIALFGPVLWLLAHAIDATRKYATLSTSPIHLRSHARVGSRRLTNHPGE
jgi:hypothetical protein